MISSIMGKVAVGGNVTTTNPSTTFHSVTCAKPHAEGNYGTRCSAYVSRDLNWANNVRSGSFRVVIEVVQPGWLEKASVVASAEATALYFAIAGTTLVRHGTVFELPGIVLEVAQECSGIRSSWVLVITSLLASHLFLKSPWRRLVLVAFVIPLGILRNGFRVFVIGLLCVHVGPHMVDSAIHRQGGPLFFALSLVPLFLLLWWLRRQERRVA